TGQRWAIEMWRLSSWDRSQLLVHKLQHFIARRNHLAVHFISALRFDHIDQFLNNIDIGPFQRARSQTAASVLTGCACKRLSAGVAFGEQIITKRLQSSRTDDRCRFALPQLGDFCFARQYRGNATIAGYRKTAGAFGSLAFGDARQAVSGAKIALRSAAKISCSSVSNLSIRHLDLEISR